MPHAFTSRRSLLGAAGAAAAASLAAHGRLPVILLCLAARYGQRDRDGLTPALTLGKAVREDRP